MSHDNDAGARMSSEDDEEHARTRPLSRQLTTIFGCPQVVLLIPRHFKPGTENTANDDDNDYSPSQDEDEYRELNVTPRAIKPKPSKHSAMCATLSRLPPLSTDAQRHQQHRTKDVTTQEGSSPVVPDWSPGHQVLLGGQTSASPPGGQANMVASTAKGDPPKTPTRTHPPSDPNQIGGTRHNPMTPPMATRPHAQYRHTKALDHDT